MAIAPILQPYVKQPVSGATNSDGLPVVDVEDSIYNFLSPNMGYSFPTSAYARVKKELSLLNAVKIEEGLQSNGSADQMPIAVGCDGTVTGSWDRQRYHSLPSADASLNINLGAGSGIEAFGQQQYHQVSYALAYSAGAASSEDVASGAVNPAMSHSHTGIVNEVAKDRPKVAIDYEVAVVSSEETSEGSPDHATTSPSAAVSVSEAKHDSPDRQVSERSSSSSMTTSPQTVPTAGSNDENLSSHSAGEIVAGEPSTVIVKTEFDLYHDQLMKQQEEQRLFQQQQQQQGLAQFVHHHQQQQAAVGSFQDSSTSNRIPNSIDAAEGGSGIVMPNSNTGRNGDSSLVDKEALLEMKRQIKQEFAGTDVPLWYAKGLDIQSLLRAAESVDWAKDSMDVAAGVQFKRESAASSKRSMFADEAARVARMRQSQHHGMDVKQEAMFGSYNQPIISVDSQGRYLISMVPDGDPSKQYVTTELTTQQLYELQQNQMQTYYGGSYVDPTTGTTYMYSSSGLSDGQLQGDGQDQQSGYMSHPQGSLDINSGSYWPQAQQQDDYTHSMGMGDTGPNQSQFDGSMDATQQGYTTQYYDYSYGYPMSDGQPLNDPQQQQQQQPQQQELQQHPMDMMSIHVDMSMDMSSMPYYGQPQPYQNLSLMGFLNINDDIGLDLDENDTFAVIEGLTDITHEIPELPDMPLLEGRKGNTTKAKTSKSKRKQTLKSAPTEIDMDAFLLDKM